MITELSDFRRLIIKGILFVVPFVALQLTELFILPIDAFTFRVWEAVLATPYRYPGAFYPNTYVKKDREYADQYRSGDPAKIRFKSVEWFIDSFGFRNRPEIEKRNTYDVVVTGDSNMVGSFLDQKDTLSEVLSSISGQVVYSYSYGSDHISTFFSDPRFKNNNPKLVIVEAKAGNWFRTNDYWINFQTTPGGDLEIRDRATDFTEYYDSSRNRLVERLHSRLLKQPMFHYLLSALSVEFKIAPKNVDATLKGMAIPDKSSKRDVGESGWRLPYRYVENAKVEPLGGEPQPAIRFRRTGPACYWQSEKFVSLNRDGSIRLRFEAKNSISPSPHRIYIFEDGSYRSIGEIRAGTRWRQYDIPVATKPRSILEMQIVQDDEAQWLSLRNVQVIAGGPVPAPKRKNEVPITPPGGTAVTPGTPVEASRSLDRISKAENEMVLPSVSVTSPRDPLPHPPGLTPLSGADKSLSDAEIHYYFYRAVRAMNSEARRRGMDFILVILPDSFSPKLLPPIEQLRAEGVKILAYQPNGKWPSGMDEKWFWQKADSHWSEAAVRLTADEILRMWRGHKTINRPFSADLRATYDHGFPREIPTK